ncbi:MAG TPA: hypothetical protein VN963_10285 [bacterium]|nr:hypothetical protein [bacterium]
MDTLNSNPTETVPVPVENLAGSVPASVLTPMTSTPEVTAVPAAKAATPATVPVAAVKTELPKTNGQTVGGWNRFAGYNPNAAKNKPKDGRGGPGGRK